MVESRRTRKSRVLELPCERRGQGWAENLNMPLLRERVSALMSDQLTGGLRPALRLRLHEERAVGDQIVSLLLTGQSGGEI
jgi:hypothetical protein